MPDLSRKSMTFVIPFDGQFADIYETGHRQSAARSAALRPQQSARIRCDLPASALRPTPSPAHRSIPPLDTVYGSDVRVIQRRTKFRFALKVSPAGL